MVRYLEYDVEAIEEQGFEDIETGKRYSVDWNFDEIVNLLNEQEEKIQELELNCTIAHNGMNFFGELIKNVMLEKLKDQEVMMSLQQIVEEMAKTVEELEKYQKEGD